MMKDKKFIKLNNSNLTGYLISEDINSDTCIVMINNKKIKTSNLNITHIEDNNINIKKDINFNITNYTFINPSSNFSNEIMLRHKTKDDAIFELEQFIIEAHACNVYKIKIVHGKQGGILRNAVHDYLKRSKLIESFNLGSYFEGQFGVTIAYIKNNDSLYKK